MTTLVDGVAAAGMLGMTPATFRQYARRNADALPVRARRRRRNMYDLADLEHHANIRLRINDNDESTRQRPHPN